MSVQQIHIGNAEDEGLTVTMHGKAEDIMKVLINGLERQDLVRLNDALVEELADRAQAKADEKA